jgi:DNA polymerase-3 subunit epsilon
MSPRQLEHGVLLVKLAFLESPASNEPDIFAIDFEGNKRLGIVEAGVVRLRGGAVVDAWTDLFAPKADGSLWELRMTGLDRDDLEGRPLFGSTAWERFRDWRRAGPFCAHNASFENNMLARTWPYPGEVPDFSHDYAEPRADWGPWLDTCTLGRRLRLASNDCKLETLTRFFSLETELTSLAERWCPEDRRGWHRALYDALASAVLLTHLRTLLPGQSLPMLYRFQTQTRRNTGQLFLL